MNVTVGKKLQNLRKQTSLSQEYVANKLHISQSAYVRIENGESLRGQIISTNFMNYLRLLLKNW